MSPSDEFALLRQQMVAEQLKTRGIKDHKVLAAMLSVPRELFVQKRHIDQAYTDAALGIDCEQTISQPLMVALMSEALCLTGSERVLEIGTGSGYQTAVLAHLLTKGGELFSMERHPDLAHAAEERLTQIGCNDVHLLVGDGSLGWPTVAPFDRILVTAAAPHCPAALLEQLALGGKLVIPIGPRSVQTLQVFSKEMDDTVSTLKLTGCRFVPLIGEGS
tara:strand:+ start:76 stop:732 length:657 start_codon:yes stop_codon:yes gene_type:complete